ncbi:28S ribosomal protein S36, mitochondrial [Sceloporus undulatus]|uniref:28S ribosomal protein S36, mitochondrial n=1 Tax=Sceloporus undulatus TaxID=8520 RepID=UPI001C4BF2FC|nr:28S ribosomal protein S36, mitochondrial [Sceloporus undulatus]
MQQVTPLSSEGVAYTSPAHEPRWPYLGGGVTMGSKMAAASRVVQVVKPHTPLIKFPDRKSAPRPKLQEPLQSRVPPLHASSTEISAEGRPPSHQHISFSGRTQGTPDTLELVRTLPQKYRRKLLSAEEMEYIQRGGPE